jgi:hypothetical protein
MWTDAEIEEQEANHCHQCLERLVAGDVVEVPGEGSLCRECANDWQEEMRHETTAVEVPR